MRKITLTLFLLFCALLSACAGAPKLSDSIAITASHGDGRVGTYVSSGQGYNTNSYWIEGPSGLILIDTQFLLSAGHEALEVAEKLTGKKVVLAIVLHPNPDKFNGTSELQKRGIRVLTSDQVRKLIPDVHRDRHYWFYKRYQPDYPDTVPLPDSFGDQTTRLTAGGITVTAHVLGGPGCSEAHVVVEYEGHVFTGDLVASQAHSWLELGKLDEWLDRIAEIRAFEPDYVHPGRGPSGGSDLLDREETYLRRVKHLMTALHPQGAMRESLIAPVKAQLEREYPAYSYDYFLEIGLPSVWEAMAKSHKKTR